MASDTRIIVATLIIIIAILAAVAGYLYYDNMQKEKEAQQKQMEELLRIMSEVRPDIDFETEDKLIDNEMLDSLDIVAIVTDVNDEFDVDINVNDLLPENFNTVEAMWDLIQKLQNE